jgi:hypothetical protein
MGCKQSNPKDTKEPLKIASKTVAAAKGAAASNKCVKLYYFDVYGRGEAIRMLLNHKGVTFEDCRFGFDKWPEFKPKMPAG